MNNQNWDRRNPYGSPRGQSTQNNNPYYRQPYQQSPYTGGNQYYGGSQQRSPYYNVCQSYGSASNGATTKGKFFSTFIVVLLVVVLVVVGGIALAGASYKSTGRLEDIQKSSARAASEDKYRKEYDDLKKKDDSLDNSEKSLSDSTSNDGIVTNQKIYHYDDASNYKTYASDVEAMYDKWLHLDPNKAFDYIPKNQSGVDYYEAWLYILEDRKAALIFGDARSTTDLNEAEAYYQGQIEELNQLEQKFMKNEDLNITVDIKRSDGTTFKSDGKAPDQNSITPKPSDVDAIENKIKSDSYGPSADGTYFQAGEKLALNAGLNVDYDFGDLNSYCKGDFHDLMGKAPLGAFCTGSPYVVYVNKDNEHYAEDSRDPYWIDMMKHEVSHSLIFKRCGSIRPPVGVESEALTNSYAVRYLGADAGRVAKSANGNPHYMMTAASDAAADKVHAGQCS